MLVNDAAKGDIASLALDSSQVMWGRTPSSVPRKPALSEAEGTKPSQVPQLLVSLVIRSATDASPMHLRTRPSSRNEAAAPSAS